MKKRILLAFLAVIATAILAASLNGGWTWDTKAGTTAWTAL